MNPMQDTDDLIQKLIKIFNIPKERKVYRVEMDVGYDRFPQIKISFYPTLEELRKISEMEELKKITPTLITEKR